MAVMAAKTVVIAFWAAVGLVKPGMVNVIAWPPLKFPAINEMFSTKGPAPLSTAVPAAPAAGAVKVIVPAPVSARPAPVSVINSFPLLATVVPGVSDTLMVTDVAPLTTLLRVMAGALVPRLCIIYSASTPTDRPASTLDDRWKPVVAAGRAAPRVSPFRVITVEVASKVKPEVVRTTEVLVAVAAGDEVAVKDVTPLAMEVTDPKK